MIGRAPGKSHAQQGAPAAPRSHEHGYGIEILILAQGRHHGGLRRCRGPGPG